MDAVAADPLALTRAALVDCSDRGRLELRGEDRVRFLGGLVTCDVASLEPGSGAYGFFTSPQGRILSDVVVLALEDRLWLEIPAGLHGEISEHLEKYIVADRVEVHGLADLVLMRLLYPEGSAPDFGRGLGDAPFAHARVLCGATEIHAARTPLWGAGAVTLWLSSGVAEPTLDELVVAADAERADPDRADLQRITAGIPRFGVDFDASNLPQETRLDGAVSYEKGCYLGQEIVARLHYRGQPAREIRRLSGKGEPPAPGAPLELAGAPVGTVTSAVPSPRGWVGLAMVARKGLEATELELGGAVRVEEPPQLRLS